MSNIFGQVKLTAQQTALLAESLPSEVTSNKLTSEFGRKLSGFFADKKPNSFKRYWISIETYTRLIEQSEAPPVETDGSLDVQTRADALKLGYYATFVDAAGNRFPLFVSKVMRMFPEGHIFVETLDLEKSIHENRKDLHAVWDSDITKG